MKRKIGYDTSVVDDGTEISRLPVVVEADYGEVTIDCPEFSGDWMGYKTLAKFNDYAEAEKLILKISAAPVAELTALGYDVSGDWFEAEPLK